MFRKENGWPLILFLERYIEKPDFNCSVLNPDIKLLGFKAESSETAPRNQYELGHWPHNRRDAWQASCAANWFGRYFRMLDFGMKSM